MGIFFSKRNERISLSKNDADCGLFEAITQGSKFALPTNVDKLDFQHYIARELWNDDFRAPVKDVLNAGNARILDVETGTGVWVMQCAEKFPWSNFTGVDVFPRYPKVIDIELINVTFLQTNILNGLPFDDNTFDFVHMSHLILAFTEEQWKDQVLRELVRVCKPGGWIELVEQDRTYINEGPTFKKVNGAIQEYFTSRGVKPILGDNLAVYLKQTQQVSDIMQEVKHPPYYGCKLGKALGKILVKNLQDFETVLTSYMGYSNEEWHEVVKTIKKETVKYKTKGIMRRVYGQKLYL